MEDITSKIKEINDYLQKCAWMDFSYDEINDVSIKIIGSIDLSWQNYHSIELEFERPTNIITILSDWQKHDALMFIELATEKEIEKKFGTIDNHYYVFKINVDGFLESPIWIVAKTLKYKILPLPSM